MPFDGVDLIAFLPTLKYKKAANIEELVYTYDTDDVDYVLMDYHEPIPHDKISNGVIEYSPDRTIDLIDNIHFNSTKKYKLEYEIGGILHNQLDIYGFVGAYYQPLIIKVIFLEPIDETDEFSFSFRSYYLTAEIRNKLLQSNLLTKYKIYSRGCCYNHPKHLQTQCPGQTRNSL